MLLAVFVAGAAGLVGAPAAVGSGEVRVIEWSGRVELARGGGAGWALVGTNTVLRVGDGLRTGAESRATLQFSDRSVFRLNESSELRISPPGTTGPGRRGLFLRMGSLFFLDRERPASIDIQTPTAVSAIRGTEFHLAVRSGVGGVVTVLALLDGEVGVRGAGGEVVVKSGEEVEVSGDGVPRVAPLVQARAVMQWCLFYPGFLCPEELSFDATERQVFAESVAHYDRGDLLGALGAAPHAEVVRSQAGRVYLAALKLSVGRFEEAERIVGEGTMPGWVRAAFGELLEAVTGRVDAGAGEEPTTATGWLARSYLLQSRSRLVEARESVRRAVSMVPTSGYGWIRLGELEWALGDRRAALAALAEGQRLSPTNPHGHTLRGFVELERGRTRQAQVHFQEAHRVDAAFANAWVGLGLVEARHGNGRRALEFFQVAAVMEPQRGELRSYLGKALGFVGLDALAEEEMSLAKQLDPGDPTPWLYSGLMAQGDRRYGTAIREIEESVARNDNRSLFRSRLLLDSDRAIRSADLSVSYSLAGLDEVGRRRAARAVEEDYTGFSGHLFRARMLQSQEDPFRRDLRYESSRQGELLVANLLAPPGAGNLSQLLSQQDHLRLFERERPGASSFSRYRSAGEWEQAVTVYGMAGGMGYAVDASHRSLKDPGYEETWVTSQVKQRLGDRDGLYFQAGVLERAGGEIDRNMGSVVPDGGYHFREAQAPFGYLGYHREWGPGMHTLVLGGLFRDRLRIEDPSPEVLFLRRQAGGPFSIQVDPFFDQVQRSRFELGTAEVQQIWQTDEQLVVAGFAYQGGSVVVDEALSRELTPPLPESGGGMNYESGRGYVRYSRELWDRLRVTGGMGYDWLMLPRNSTWPPVGEGESTRAAWTHRWGVGYDLWRGGRVRAAYARSLGGYEFATSVGLEPTELAGFEARYRNLLPARLGGVTAGLKQELMGVGFDQAFSGSVYAGWVAEVRREHGTRVLGVVENSTPVAVPDRVGGVIQRLEYEERSLMVYLNWLRGDHGSVGVRYEISRVELMDDFPGLPAGLPGAEEIMESGHSTVGHLELNGRLQLRPGWFLRWRSDWFEPLSRFGGSGESVWFHACWLGYEFDRRRAEIRVGMLNLTDAGVPTGLLNHQESLVSERTLELSVRLNF